MLKLNQLKIREGYNKRKRSFKENLKWDFREKMEREFIKDWAQHLNTAGHELKVLKLSAIGSKEKWDVIFKWKDQNWIGDIKIVELNKGDMYNQIKSQWSTLTKRTNKEHHMIKMNKVYSIQSACRAMNKRGYDFKPAFIYIFKDAIAIWDISNFDINDSNQWDWIDDWATSTGRRSNKKTRHLYHKYLTIDRASVYSNKLRPKRTWRNEDCEFFYENSLDIQ